MFALLQISDGSILAYLCVIAGFLVIVASVVFVIKGKAALSESGAPNAVAWGQIKANLTSVVALFVLGATLVALPFWEVGRAPATALLSGSITGPGRNDTRLFLVEKPDYDQTYRGGIIWQVPLISGKAAYSVIYTQGGAIVGEQPFSVSATGPGAALQKITLPPLDMQIESATSEPATTPDLKVTNEEVKKNLAHH
jgi:hypothetical protein